MGHNPILLFDGVCNLCNGAVKFIIKADKKGKFKLASLQSESGQALLKRFNLPRENFTSFVFIDGEKCHLRSSAVLRVLRELGGVWKVFFIFIIVPKPLGDFIYNLIAGNRYKIFGKQDSCMIPTREIQERFLP
jgi:predicted DCC family thiol-disulfide oxidoreductase YuxK